MKSLELTLTANTRSVAEARGAVTEHFRDLPGEVLADLRLVLTELVSNAVLHGNLGPGAPITVHVEADGGRVRGEVRDPGAGAPAQRTPDQRAGGGLGLHIVERLSRAWGVERAPEKRVWFEIAA